ncbi:hypothetical protein TNCV_852161 [Trichonephila clavipes]|nr:hypothetical protein TNCV_852161 [Trichonephila clavipes]
MSRPMTQVGLFRIILKGYKQRDAHRKSVTNHNSAIQTNQDIPAETVSKNNSDSVTTPSCHVRPTNQDTLSQAGPITSGHTYNLDMG